MAHGFWLLSFLSRWLLIFYRLFCCFNSCINSCIERDAWKDLCCFQDITDQFGLVCFVMENKVVVLVLYVDRRGRVYKGMQSNWLTAFGCWAFWVGDCLYFIVCFVVSITVSIAVLKEMLGRICAASRTLLINLDWYIKSWRIKLLFWS